MSVPLTLNLEEATLDALDRMAERTARSRDWLMSRAIEDYVAVAQIEAGLAAADIGDFASQEDVARLRAKYALAE